LQLRVLTVGDVGVEIKTLNKQPITRAVRRLIPKDSKIFPWRYDEFEELQ